MATILKTAEQHMDKSLDALNRELGLVRTGVANASILNRTLVDYYGVKTPVNQVASVSTPEPRMLLISPYDPNTLKDIEKAILQSDIGITPNNDGEVIRLVVPQLTKDRREQLAKEISKYGETAKVSIRNIRRDAIAESKEAEKNNELTEDDLHLLEKDIQDLTNKFSKKIDAMIERKSQEILSD
ncbi:MAG: ribosome recycling factor [Bavariicoccus seileri]